MLGFDTELPFIYVIGCIILGLLYAYFLYVKEDSLSSNRLVWILFLFRTSLVSFLALLLLSPIVKSYFNIIEKPIVLIAKDNSASVKDSINYELKFLENSLQDFEVQKYSFSDKVLEGIIHDNTGLKTNYSNLFSTLNNKYENRNVAALILASDGSYNVGGNPEFISYNFPVYSIALGDTNTYKDIRIDNVLMNDISFLGNTFPMEISLVSKLDKSAKSRLTIWHKNKKVHQQIINFSANNDYQTVLVQLNSDEVGLQTYTIELDVLEGERNLSNNVFKSYIDVIDSRHNILILKQANHPDLAAYKSVIEKNKNYNIEVKDIDEDILIERYQLIVLFGVDNIPTALVESTLPLLVFNAQQEHYYTMGSMVNFIIKGSMEDIFVVKNEEFTKFTFSPNLLQFISSAPPISSLYGKYKKIGSVDYILNQRIGSYISNNPVMFLEESSSRKIVFVTAEGWWKWKLFDFSINKNNELFDELFSKLSQYLLLQEDKGRFRVEYFNQIDEGSDIVMRATLYNESYELVNDNEIELLLYDIKNNEYVFQFTRQGDGYIVNAGALDIGTYNFTAKVHNSDFIKKGSFDVKKLQLEQINLAADHKLLKKIGFISGGKIFHKNNIESLANTLNESTRKKKIIHSQEKLESLINIPWILLSLLLLISIEWIIRKYNGLI